MPSSVSIWNLAGQLHFADFLEFRMTSFLVGLPLLEQRPDVKNEIFHEWNSRMLQRAMSKFVPRKVVKFRTEVRLPLQDHGRLSRTDKAPQRSSRRLSISRSQITEISMPWNKFGSRGSHPGWRRIRRAFK